MLNAVETKLIKELKKEIELLRKEMTKLCKQMGGK